MTGSAVQGSGCSRQKEQHEQSTEILRNTMFGTWGVAQGGKNLGRKSGRGSMSLRQ